MFKKILTACAGLVLSSGLAFGFDVNGTYTGQSNNGQNVSIILRSQDGLVRGVLAVDGTTLPLVAREMNGQMQGVYRTAGGQDVPFMAVAGPNGLQVQTSGGAFSLARGQSSEAPTGYNPAPAAQFNPGQPASAPEQANPNSPVDAPQVQLEPRQGRAMQAAIPAGWSFSDTNNGIDTSAPDGITWVSHTWLRGNGRTNPDLFLQSNMRMWPQWGLTNARLISAKNINGQSKLYDFEYLCRNRPAHAWVQVTVSPAPEGFMAEMVLIQTSPENFEAYKPMMIDIAKSVQPLSAATFCDGGQANAEIMKRAGIRAQCARDVADIRNQAYAYRSQVQDHMRLQASDTRRDQTRFDDGSTQVTAPLQAQRAFRNADGSYSYSTNNYDPVPSGATELPAHTYR